MSTRHHGPGLLRHELRGERVAGGNAEPHNRQAMSSAYSFSDPLPLPRSHKPHGLTVPYAPRPCGQRISETTKMPAARTTAVTAAQKAN